MGFLSTAGAPLTFAELQKVKNFIKKHGVLQFLNLYRIYKDRMLSRQQALKWGDEVEYHVVYFDHVMKQARVLANAGDFQDGFNVSKASSIAHAQPEYGAWMLETIPPRPCDHIKLSDIASLDIMFHERRQAIIDYLSRFGPISLSSSASYPLLGVGDYAMRLPHIHDVIQQEIDGAKKLAGHEGPRRDSAAEKDAKNQEVQAVSEEVKEEKKEKRKESEMETENKESDKPMTTADNVASQSLFTFDAVINAHPRFPTLSRHIRERRSEKVCIKVPMYIDINTDLQAPPTPEDPYPGYIYMDSMAFGMGCCCLQLTFEGQSLEHTRHLHDQLLVLGPILAALSASAPIYRGKLADIDLRYNVISQSVDDRTPAERDPANPSYVHKSRYSTNSHFISAGPAVLSHHNDCPPLPVDPELLRMLHQEGVDPRLAYHIAALFVRDPLVVFEKAIEVDDSKVTAHFENLQSTNWNSMRFKPPPGVDSPIGWRVEFRPMDIQLTDGENAALSALLSLLVKLISEFDVNFIIPISLCDENMERAHHRDAALNEKFYFRTNVLDPSTYRRQHLKKANFMSSARRQVWETEVIEQMTLAEILEGKSAAGFPGLIPLLKELLEDEPGTKEEKDKIRGYLDFLSGRARGVYKTGARYLRDFVASHPEYRKDSIISPRVNYDLLMHFDELNAKNIAPHVIYATSSTALPHVDDYKEVNVPFSVHSTELFDCF